MLRLPKSSQFTLYWGFSFFLLLFLFRFAFWWYFRFDDRAEEYVGPTLEAFGYGARFDIRLVCSILLPFLIFSSIPQLSPFKNIRTRFFWIFYFAATGVLVALCYIFDFGYFSYCKVRINASIFNFIENIIDSANMIWESYHIAPISLSLILFGFIYFKFIKYLFIYIFKKTSEENGKLKNAIFGTFLLSLVGFGIHGKFSQYPLRWSDAFFQSNSFISNLGLNPVLNLIDTMDYKTTRYNLERVRAAYPRMAQYLQVEHPDPKTLNFSRLIAPRIGALDGNPNVVLIFVESFSAYKTSLFGNRIKTTPYFDLLSKNGLLFTRYFTPHAGTARGIFATITGIPDVELNNTSSRNPGAVDQHVIMSSNFKDYLKFYFTGGSTSWANIRGILKNNIKDIKIYEENSFKSPRNDVWGISDSDLFKEANQILSQQKKSFFAVIQTSGNHRPYTIPTGLKDFHKINFNADFLRQNGFTSNEECNSFRYMDYSIQKFIEAAKHEKYFDSTIFVFTGDHGISGNVPSNFPSSWNNSYLSSIHTPFLIYAPKLISPGIVKKIASQVDIMPTISGFMNRSYINTTLGKDLLNPRYETAQAFMINSGNGPEMGCISERYLFSMQADDSRKKLVFTELDNKVINIGYMYPEIEKKMQEFTRDYYETARYLLLNNKNLH